MIAWKFYVAIENDAFAKNGSDVSRILTYIEK
jgi:hypothetical protein